MIAKGLLLLADDPADSTILLNPVTVLVRLGKSTHITYSGHGAMRVIPMVLIDNAYDAVLNVLNQLVFGPCARARYWEDK